LSERGGPNVRRRHRGWIGLIGILIALVIVAVLAQTVLRSYGLLGSSDRAAAGPRTPPSVTPAGEPAPAVPAVMAPIERAKGVEQQVQRDAQNLGQRIEEQTK
jgi:hypothetical protein